MAKPASPAKPIKPFQPKTLAQNSKIWALKGEMFLSEDNLREVVEQITGERSISRLSLQQARAVIDRLEDYKKRQKKSEREARAKSGNVILIANTKQRDMIRSMADQVKWKYPDGFQRFLKSRLGLDAIKTNEDVTAVKKALENMIETQRKKSETSIYE